MTEQEFSQYNDNTWSYIDNNNTKIWVNDQNRYHRDNDKPALIKENRTAIWCINGLCHRDDDKPAVVKFDGTQEWFQNDLRHRGGNLPAVIKPGRVIEYWEEGNMKSRHIIRDDGSQNEIVVSGTKRWYKNNQYPIRHRDNDLPAVIGYGGELVWYRDDKRHRDNDQPAVINPKTGLMMWYQEGKLHREGGNPAVITDSGREEYWLNGKQLFPDQVDITDLEEVGSKVIQISHKTPIDTAIPGIIINILIEGDCEYVVYSNGGESWNFGKKFKVTVQTGKSISEQHIDRRDLFQNTDLESQLKSVVADSYNEYKNNRK